MKSNSIWAGLLILLTGTIGLSSCNLVAETNQLPGVNLVSVDNEGITTVNDNALKTLDLATGAITPEQSQWLVFMREEEKLARDLYLAFSKDFNQPVFKNIAKAEQNHMDAVLTVLSAYGIEDPASPDEGIFANADLQALYSTLLAQGKAGLTEALNVGALVEETDILDLAKVYELTAPDDLTALAGALTLGSRNHLRAFVKVLKVNGVVYSPVALSEEEYNAIVTTAWEKGNGFCRGTGTPAGGNGCKGRGKGFMGGR